MAVLDGKRGSGKTTLASSIAAWCAQNGWGVVLGDVGTDASSRNWLARRDARAAPVNTWAVGDGRVLRVPRGTRHVVLDNSRFPARPGTVPSSGHPLTRSSFLSALCILNGKLRSGSSTNFANTTGWPADTAGWWRWACDGPERERTCG